MSLSKITEGDTLLEQIPSRTITFRGNLRFHLISPLVSAAARFAAHIRSF